MSQAGKTRGLALRTLHGFFVTGDSIDLVDLENRQRTWERHQGTWPPAL